MLVLVLFSGVLGDSMEVKKIEPPDWDLWLKMGAVELWQGVALSMNFEPDSEALRTVKFDGYRAVNAPKDYCDCLRIVMSNLPDTQVRSTFYLADLVAWFKQAAWEMPPQLDVLEAQPQVNEVRPAKSRLKANEQHRQTVLKAVIEHGRSDGTRPIDQKAVRRLKAKVRESLVKGGFTENNFETGWKQLAQSD